MISASVIDQRQSHTTSYIVFFIKKKEMNFLTRSRSICHVLKLFLKLKNLKLFSTVLTFQIKSLTHETSQ